MTVGSPFSGLYTFESTTPDSDPGEPRRGLYNDAIREVEGYVGTYHLQGPVGSTTLVSVVDLQRSLYDEYLVSAPVEFGGVTLDFAVQLFDSSGEALEGDSLPLVPPVLSLFDLPRFLIFDQSEAIPLTVRGELRSLVPEPGTLVSLAIGVLIATTRRRAAFPGSRDRRS